LASSALTHYNGGSSGAGPWRSSRLWLTNPDRFARPACSKNCFYRGYAIERLEALGLNRFLGGHLFRSSSSGVAHWTRRLGPNIVIALVLGAVLSLFYLLATRSSWPT